MVGTISFKKFSGDNVDYIEYVKNYIKEHNDINVEILIGTDSQNKGNYTVYSTVIVLYNPGHGGHCIFKRWKTPKEKVKNIRLLKEVEESINIANELVQHGIQKPKYIDLDINPNPKYKSNEVYESATGWVKSLGYEVRFKTIGPLVTTIADWLVKS